MRTQFDTGKKSTLFVTTEQVSANRSVLTTSVSQACAESPTLLQLAMKIICGYVQAELISKLLLLRRNKIKNLLMLICLIFFVAVSLLCFGCDSLDYEEETFSYADYKEIEVRQLVKSLDVNPAKAAKLFEGQSLKIVGGRIENIDANGTQFSLNGGEIFINSIVCTVEEDSPAQQQLLTLAHGQSIVVYGIVDRVENITNMNEIFSNPSHIGDLYGIVISVVKIEDLKTTSTNTHAVKNPKI